MTSLNSLEIPRDYPCANCGYNLHGLNPLAVCPECGTPIRDTVIQQRALAAARQSKKIPRPDQCDPAAFGQWIEGLICILSGFAVGVSGAILSLDHDFARWHSPTRVVALGVVVTAWVIVHLGMWKIGFAGAKHRSNFDSLRVPTALFVFLPAVFAATESGIGEILPSLIGGFIIVIFLLAGPTAAILLNLRLVRLSHIVDRPIAGVCFYILTALMPLAMITTTIFLDGGSDRSSLHFMLQLPTAAFGNAAFLVEVLKSRYSEILETLFAGFPLFPIAVNTVLLRRLIHVRRELKM